MQEAVYRVLTLVSALVAVVPIGTNLGLLHLFWMMRCEEAFSKVKAFLRRAKPRTDDDLRTTTWAAFNSITPTDAAGWFAHCGYPPPAHSS